MRNKVQFGFSHFLNDQRMDEEVIARYPEHEKEIRNFVQMIRRSVTLASVLLGIILIFGYILMKSR